MKKDQGHDSQEVIVLKSHERTRYPRYLDHNLLPSVPVNTNSPEIKPQSTIGAGKSKHLPLASVGIGLGVMVGLGPK